MAASSETNLETGGDQLAKPLHLQRLEHAVRLDPFLSYVGNFFTNSTSDSESSPDEASKAPNFRDGVKDVKCVNGLYTTKQERRNDKSMLYNFSKVKKTRRWLKNMLLSDSSDSEIDESESISDEKLQEMLKMHKLIKSYRSNFHADRELQQYQYYSVGMLSNQDRFYEHQKSVIGNKKKTKEKKIDKKIKAKLKKIKMKEKRIKQEPNDDDSPDTTQLDESFGDLFIPKPKRKSAVVNEVTLANKRKKLWVALCKKEVSKAQKQKVSARKETLTNCKKLAQACQKEIRKTAIHSQKLLKETPSRAKRLTREMLVYWKRYEKVEKEHRKKAEKEAQEQLKMDIELREAKRQQRKLNFLITQTELYAHFMSRKMGISAENFKDKILGQLDETLPKLSGDAGLMLDIEDDYDVDAMKNQALKNVQNAYSTQQVKTRKFDNEVAHSLKIEDFRLTDPSVSTDQDRPQPQMFEGVLKTYQLKGMNWLANLYHQGLNGILADEMGLGKTVQSIAFLAHIAESQGIWGPFLVIAPASTLHNWQQEFSRFVSKFKVVPYWGNTNDRKILRKFWNQKDLHTEDASFHILVTSYQLVVQDVKYFQRIKWQYMILDEAQAIKSSASARWKSLLGFSCRNRLLLTGTPIQNSMAELWALLHFIMPTLFDSHEEFNEWFSKDIESHAENKSTIDEKHLSRLHLILKPFMLRRIKKDVENELSDKIEILLYCHLTTRQKHLYEGLKKKISIDDLLHSSSANASSQSQSATSSLMNLVMQFRLFVVSGLSDRKIFENLFCIYNPENVYRSLFSQTDNDSCSSSFSFLRFINLSPAELMQIFLSDLLIRWLYILMKIKAAYHIYHKTQWAPKTTNYLINNTELMMWPNFTLSIPQVQSSPVLSSLVFTTYTSSLYTHTTHVHHYIAETSSHRDLRAKKVAAAAKSALQSSKQITAAQGGTTVLPKSPLKISPKKLQSPPSTITETNFPFHSHIERPPITFHCQPTVMPAFLTYLCPKVAAPFRECYCSDKSATLWQKRLQLTGNPDTFNVIKSGKQENFDQHESRRQFTTVSMGGLAGSYPQHGWSQIVVPDKETLVTDSGKLEVLDGLLKTLKLHGHRVLIYSQMTRMIDLLEEYMWHRKHTYMRLDGSSKISDRRDMVADFQTRSDIFVFLLSTRAGGLGINLTAADTVVFYDSDWNPTVDQQAMDRAHRLGQTKQVTVYRLVCKGTIEERILQRAREKSEIQRMVISGGNFKPDTLKPKEVVSLLLDDDELEKKFRQRQAEKKQQEDPIKDKDKKRKRDKYSEKIPTTKRRKGDENTVTPANSSIPLAPQDAEFLLSVDSISASPNPSEKSFSSVPCPQDETSNEGSLVVDDTSPSVTPLQASSNNSTSAVISGQVAPKKAGKPSRGTGRGRGRPKGSGKRGCGRGRGSTLAAAEIAGAQAGMSAAYAAYGYSLPSAGGSPSLRGSSLGRGHRAILRGSNSLAARSNSTGRALYRPAAPTSLAPNHLNVATASSSTPATHPPVMGFYTQGPET
uniref:Chromatin-remodeling ATPase INO80 n=1 Tax=Strigamia maritima TaxID=126957 RepID=T1IPW9_STRMM